MCCTSQTSQTIDMNHLTCSCYSAQLSFTCLVLPWSQQRHYSFCIKKCGKLDCDICKPPRLPPEVFTTLAFLTDPVPQGDGRYKPFNTVYNTVTSEEHRPSLQNRPARQKTLPFVASVQHAKKSAKCGVLCTVSTS